MKTPRPTPETDEVFDAYARCACGTACIRVRMQLLERERDEAREQLKAMREAIKAAHDSLLECREQLDRMTQEGIKERATNTLAKLQPFLKP